MQTTTDSRGLHPTNNSFALAVAVIRERVSTLPQEDKDALYALLPHLFSEDEDELQAARCAVNEILDQDDGSVQTFHVPENASSLADWIDYASNKIKELRKAAGMTQVELAEKSNIPQSYISRLENGEHSPTAKTISKIAKALGVSAKEIDPSAE